MKRILLLILLSLPAHASPIKVNCENGYCRLTQEDWDAVERYVKALNKSCAVKT